MKRCNTPFVTKKHASFLPHLFIRIPSPSFFAGLLVLVFTLCATGSCVGPNQYIGMELDSIAYPHDQCRLSEMACCQPMDDFLFCYSFLVQEGDQYTLSGHVIWRGSELYQQVSRTYFDFFIVKDRRIIDLVRVWISGDMYRPIKFSKRFTQEQVPDYAFIGLGYYRIRE